MCSSDLRCRTELRRAGRRSVREIPIDDPSGPSPRGAGGVVATYSAPGPLLGDRVVEAEAIRHAFLRLDPDDRVLLAMHYVEDRRVAEIAAALSIPVGTVKWRLSRARAALERALEAQR